MSSCRGDKRHVRRGGSHGQKEVKCKQARLSININEDSQISQQFLIYQKLLDAKYDKHERLVKLSRDVTIESKRTIFMLQRVTGREEEKESILSEAEKKLLNIQNTKWSKISAELQGEDPYQFIKAYSPGLQEYIEALSFYHYLKHGKLIPLADVQETLVFPCTDKEKSEADTQNSHLKYEQEPSGKSSQSTDEEHSVSSHQSEKTPEVTKQSSIHVPPMEYMLGIGDLTGELMRVAINSIGMGDSSKPFELCNFLRCIYDSFLLFGNVNRELSRKLNTLKQSLQKVETGCYTLQVRGSEMSKYVLADALNDSGSAQMAGFDVESTSGYLT